jgi:hypothetical protein
MHAVGQRLVVGEQLTQAIDRSVGIDGAAAVDDLAQAERAAQIELEIPAVRDAVCRAAFEEVDDRMKRGDEQEIVVGAQRAELGLDQVCAAPEFLPRRHRRVDAFEAQIEREAPAHFHVALVDVGPARVEDEDRELRLLEGEEAEQTPQIVRTVVGRDNE